MKTFLLTVVMGFVLSPSALLRRNAAHVTERTPSKVEVSARLLFLDTTGFPARWNMAENNLNAQLAMDARTQSCALSLPSPEGGWNVTWKEGLVSSAQGSWPSLEALLSGVCGFFMAASSKGEARAALERLLSSLKVETKTSRLELLEREVLYAIGAEGKRAPQYWIGKEDFAARGLKWLDAAGVLWELRFKKSEGFFHSIELRREGQVSLRLMAQTKGG